MSFATNLKRLMTEQRVTVAQLAEDLGTSTVSVQHWRNGRWEPKMSRAVKLAKRLKTTVEALAE